MIAVDTSALVAVVARETGFERLAVLMASEPDLVISAGTLAEAMVVAAGRGFADEMSGLVEKLGFTVVPVTAGVAKRIGEAYGRWGKGQHPARLNFGDCFAYETAKAYDCPLLYIGDDFARTDLVAAVARGT